MHFSSTELSQSYWRGCVEIHLFNGGYAGLEPIEQGGVNLCFLIEQDIYKACGSNWTGVLAWLGHSSSHLQQRLAHLTARWPEPLAVAGIPYGYIGSPDAAVPGLFRLGDQVAVIPSFAGDGIAIALHTASLAVQVHYAGGDSNSYQRQACKQLTPPVRNASLVAAMLYSGAGRNTVFTLARLSPIWLREKLLRELVRRTRVFNQVPASLDLT
ncbi:MAG: hypothetical protein Q7T48_21575 [Cellvibrio sp.]|uniref:hypothetical protein n=1 Tax=Cellvibrio sp. TaxID=1965322 RepID=UPI00271ED7E3|nr:hypothetical protein [Cellvibrio sp.]